MYFVNGSTLFNVDQSNVFRKFNDTIEKDPENMTPVYKEKECGGERKYFENIEDVEVFCRKLWQADDKENPQPDWLNESTMNPQPDWLNESTMNPQPDWLNESTMNPQPDWLNESTMNPQPDWLNESTMNPQPDWLNESTDEATT